MKYGKNDDAITLRAEVDAVWKTMGNHAPYIRMDECKLQGVSRRERYATADFSQKCHAKA